MSKCAEPYLDATACSVGAKLDVPSVSGTLPKVLFVSRQFDVFPSERGITPLYKVWRQRQILPEKALFFLEEFSQVLEQIGPCAQ